MKLKDVMVALVIGIVLIAILTSASVLHKYYTDKQKANMSVEEIQALEDKGKPKVKVIDEYSIDADGNRIDKGIELDLDRESDFFLDLDDEGNIIEYDENGDIIEFDEFGNRVLTDEQLVNQEPVPFDPGYDVTDTTYDDVNTDGVADIVDSVLNSREISSEPARVKRLNIPRFNKAIDFKTLDAKNPDMFGWVRNDDFIDYPVVTSTDGQKYLNTAFDGSKNSSGTIFTLDNTAASDDNLSFYGHTMGRTRTDFFASLHKYKDEIYRNTYKDFQFVTPYGSREYEVFAIFEMDIANDAFNPFVANFHNKNERLDFYDTVVKKSMIETNHVFSEDNNYMTLITCLHGGLDITDRFIVVAIEKK